MVLLHLKTDNTNNLVLAKFDSIYDDAYIQFSNINNSIYYAGLSKNSIKIYNPNNAKDNGLFYNNNILSVRNIDTQIIDYNSYTVFPNDFTPFGEYEFTEVDTIGTNKCDRCFDNDDTTFWNSPSIYNPLTAFVRSDFASRYTFQDSVGYWIKIKFPYPIIPIGFSVNSVTNIQDPIHFDVYVSQNNINWIKILVVNVLITSGEYFFINNTNLYSYITIVITKINIDINQQNAYQSFKINSLKVFSRPIIHMNSKIKICDNNIYNVKSLNTSNLLINNVSITSINDLNTSLLTQAIDAIKNDNSFYWVKNGNIGYFNTASISKIALNSTTANALLDINGDIAYKHRSINNSLIITNKEPFSYNSSYVYIGKISFLNITKQYFKIFLYLYEIEKFYFQTITIHGYTLISTSTGVFNIIFNSYWETEFDNSYVVERITDIIYTIEYEGSTRTVIKYYIKYNDNIDFTKSRIISSSGRDYVNSIIYLDGLNTSTSTEIQFIPATNPETFAGSTFYNAILIKTINFNKNGCVYRNFNTSNLIIKNQSVNPYNLLTIDNNRTIIDSGISSNILNGLKITNPNKVIITDENGFIKISDVSSGILSNINYQTKFNNQILITNNNTIEGITVNKNNLINLNNINSVPNSLVIINHLNELTTTNSINIGVLNNIANIFNLNNPYIIEFNAAIKSNYLYIANNLLATDSKYNRITINNREIADDIFKFLIKIPNYNDYLTQILSLSAGTNLIHSYSLKFNNFINNIILEIDRSDNLGTDNRKVINIFNKSLTQYWETSINFIGYNPITYGSAKTLYNDPNGDSRCGAYVIINLQCNFLLNMYIIYVNYSSIEYSIRNFKLFGYSSVNNRWELLDFKIGIILNNNLIPNIFRINTTNYNIYSKYALCIVATWNDSATQALSTSINGIEFFGHIIDTNYYSSNLFIYNYENKLTLLGSNKVGINNLDPYSYLSIGDDLPNNSRDSILNLNHSNITNNIETPIIQITRPCNIPNINGIKATHYINSWFNSNTIYTIKLSHNNTNNESNILSLTSSGKIGIGGIPDSNLNNNCLSLFNNGINLYSNNNFINIRTSNINSSYNLILPSFAGSSNTALFINSNNNNNLQLEFADPYDKIVNRRHIKFGDQSAPTRNENGIIMQIAGKVLIGSNNIGVANLDSSFFSNTLFVAGKIYSTNDVTSDSDISYKYNIRIIDEPLTKINKINGYTFNRYDTDDDNRYTGLIAQEVIKVMPEVITKKHDGKYRIIYNNLAGLFIEGIKEIDKKMNYVNLKINIGFAIISMGFIYLLYKN